MRAGSGAWCERPTLMGQNATADRDRCVVTVCRACCCGDPLQYPGIDHDALVTDLRLRVAGRARMRISDCLLKCEQANVVVVSPSRAGRIRGGSPVWLGRILDHGQNNVIAAWIADGGPGCAPLPADLASHLTQPFSRPSMAALATTRVDDQPSRVER